MIKNTLISSMLCLVCVNTAYAATPVTYEKPNCYYVEPYSLSIETINLLDLSQYVLLDTRHQDAFAQSHIENSINIPSGESFVQWSSQMMKLSTSPIIVISGNREEAHARIKDLKNNGISGIWGYATTDTPHFFSILNSKLSSITLPTVHELYARLKERDFVVVDVRTKEEWNSGHIAGAIHYELAHIQSWINFLPRVKKIAFICGSGYRSSIAASIAKNNGYHVYDEVMSVKGGMKAWIKEGLPVEKN